METVISAALRKSSKIIGEHAHDHPSEKAKIAFQAIEEMMEAAAEGKSSQLLSLIRTKTSGRQDTIHLTNAKYNARLLAYVLMIDRKMKKTSAYKLAGRLTGIDWDAGIKQPINNYHDNKSFGTDDLKTYLNSKNGEGDSTLIYQIKNSSNIPMADENSKTMYAIAMFSNAANRHRIKYEKTAMLYDQIEKLSQDTDELSILDVDY